MTDLDHGQRSEAVVLNRIDPVGPVKRRSSMIRIPCTLTFVLIAGAMVAGCADDPYPGRQRPVYIYENPQQSGQQYRFAERRPASDPYSDSSYSDSYGQPGR